MPFEAGWRRFVALIIDIIVLAIIIWIVGLLTGNVHGGSLSMGGGASLLTLVLEFAYFIGLEGQFGATLGKMAMGIRVVKADGSPLTWGGAVIRNLLRIVDGFPYIVPYLLGAIVMWVTPKKQRLGDMAAGSVVVPRAAVANVYSSAS